MQEALNGGKIIQKFDTEQDKTFYTEHDLKELRTRFKSLIKDQDHGTRLKFDRECIEIKDTRSEYRDRI